MTDRPIGPATEDSATAAEDSAIIADDSATAAEDPANDRAQHASADVAPELFGW